MILPQFISIADRQLHSVSFLPQSSAEPEHWVLHLPAFAEEMNMCRQMVAAQSRRFSEMGFGVLVFDYSGTGDSEGELCDVDWSQWRAEAEGLIRWLLQRGAKTITLWGCRLGTLMAMDVAARPEFQPYIRQVLLWQPILSGKQFVKQFLRHRLASGLWRDALDRETPAGLYAQLQQGDRLEVSGYPIRYPLIEQIESLDLSAMAVASSFEVHWFEVGLLAGSPSRLSEGVLSLWREAGVLCQFHSMSGPPFWSVQASTTVPELIQTTLEAVTPCSNNSSASLRAEVFEGDHDTAKKPLVIDDCRTTFTFNCGRSSLIGVLEQPKVNCGDVGVLIVAGGAQYRVGAHRLFVHMSRALSAARIASMRFDYRGMGDSDGLHQGFEGVESDIRAAVDELMRRCPALKGVVLMGLCDGATASAIYAPSDSRVSGLILLNPWVHSEEGEAAAKMRHYYSKKLFHVDFWKKTLSGQLNVMDSLFGVFQSLYLITRGVFRRLFGRSVSGRSLFSKVEAGLKSFDGRVALLLSSNDLTAAEFNDRVLESGLNDRCEAGGGWDRHDIEGADHTLSNLSKKEEVMKFVADWVQAEDSSTTLSMKKYPLSSRP